MMNIAYISYFMGKSLSAEKIGLQLAVAIAASFYVNGYYPERNFHNSEKDSGALITQVTVIK